MSLLRLDHLIKPMNASNSYSPFHTSHQARTCLFRTRRTQAHAYKSSNKTQLNLASHERASELRHITINITIHLPSPY